MVMGFLIAKVYHKDYLAFIDGDNYVPGAANEYVKIFAAGFGMSNTHYCNVRVSWVQAQGQDQVAPVLKVGKGVRDSKQEPEFAAVKHYRF
jgi:hypothetical protein